LGNTLCGHIQPIHPFPLLKQYGRNSPSVYKVLSFSIDFISSFLSVITSYIGFNKGLV